MNATDLECHIPSDALEQLESVEREFKTFLFNKLNLFGRITTGLVLEYFCQKFQNIADKFVKITVPCDADVKCCYGQGCMNKHANFERKTFYVFVVSSHFTVCDVCIDRPETVGYARNSFKAYVDEYLGNQSEITNN